MQNGIKHVNDQNLRLAFHFDQQLIKERQNELYKLFLEPKMKIEINKVNANIQGIYTNQRCSYCGSQTRRSYYLELLIKNDDDQFIQDLLNLKKEIIHDKEHFNVEDQQIKEKEYSDLQKREKLFQFVCSDCFYQRKFLWQNDFHLVKKLRDPRTDEREKETLRQCLKQSDYKVLIPLMKALDHEETLFINRIIIRLALASENPLQENSVPGLLDNSSFHFAVPCRGCFDRALNGITPECEKSRCYNGFFGLRYIAISKEHQWPDQYDNYCNSCFFLYRKNFQKQNFFLLKFTPQIRVFNKIPGLSLTKPTLGQEDQNEQDFISLPEAATFKILRQHSYYTNYRQSAEEQHQRHQMMGRSQHLSQSIQHLKQKQMSQVSLNTAERRKLKEQNDISPQKRMLMRHSDPLRPQYEFMNSFFENAYVVQNKHDISRQFTLIQSPPDSFTVTQFFRQTIKEIDRILMMHHPNILRIKGFVVTTDLHSNRCSMLGKMLSQKIEEDQKYVTYFAEKMITTLDRLLEQKKSERKFEGTYLELQFPVFWRVRIAIKIMATLHFLHSRDIMYWQKTLRTGLVFFNENAEVFIPPPLIIVSESKDSHKIKNVNECGKIVTQLIIGNKDKESKCEYFMKYLAALVEFQGPVKKGTKVLEDAILAMKIACQGFQQFMQQSQTFADKTLKAKNFMQGRTNLALLKKLDTAFEKVYRGLVKFNLISDN